MANNNQGQGPPENNQGQGPPENPGSRGERFGQGQEYTCPDCNSPVKFFYNGDNEVPEGGWKNLILSSKEYMVVSSVECTNCDWQQAKRVEVHDPRR